ncbi:5-methyltetrahydropteroyltriglutamate--homocysteine S-methyltransferase [Naumannella halotolerans]|nr:5-methyltetrahydropteroyltriglutamate--homocysteine S-methyltransferase [Naumannella halotolerans]
MNSINSTPIKATVAGVPRIGPRRELKKAVEAHWAGTLDAVGLAEVAAQLRADSWNQLIDAGLDSVPTNTFSYYDQVLDTAVLLGAVPERYAAVADDLERYFAAARGNDQLPPLEMTKWFDTNYHYLVPEIDDRTAFSLNPNGILADLREAAQVVSGRAGLRPVVIGPATFLKLAKATPGSGEPFARLSELTPLYAELVSLLAADGAAWVQFDEPVLATDLTAEEISAIAEVYSTLAAVADRPAIEVAVYFGDPGEALAPLLVTGIDAIGLDLVSGSVPAGEVDLSAVQVVAGVVDGRNVWRTDPDTALQKLQELAGRAAGVAVSTSCSLLHVPYTTEGEDDLDPAVRRWLAFGTEKLSEVDLLARALNDGTDSVAAELGAAREILASRAADPRLANSAVRQRLAEVIESGAQRGSAQVREQLQAQRLGLPPLPTTTIGSFPQTPEIRRTRAGFKNGRIDETAYTKAMQDEIAAVIELQTELGLDVLVHGEPERNDMVQYFAELLEGYASTANGWVQSYGSRCVRPPILWGDVSRPEPMTVGWWQYAQSLTDKPVKGMLTGPVTIIAWSFVRDDQPLAESANQVALAIRDETVDLEAAGAAIIQVDEPALRELLPLRAADQRAYLDWSVGAFRLATSGVRDETQVHTHLCYSEFGEVIDAIAGLDADVTSIEAARSKMEIVDDLGSSGFAAAVGPGVYDIHSPRVPDTAEVAELLQLALKGVPANRLWVNPDCGLKTRGTTEVKAALQNLVAATERAREGLSV